LHLRFAITSGQKLAVTDPANRSDDLYRSFLSSSLKAWISPWREIGTGANCLRCIWRSFTRGKVMKLILIALAFVLAGTPALAQSVGEKTGVNSALGISPSTADFVKQVAISDTFEIETNKLGQERGNAAQKAFAGQMVADHTKTSNELKQLVSGGKVKAELPTALDSAHQSKLDKLKGKNGADFIAEFNDMQVSAHKDAVDLFERYANGGDNAELKAWAGKTLPALRHHLEMAQQLDKKT
jgi:putative membrane protein